MKKFLRLSSLVIIGGMGIASIGQASVFAAETKQPVKPGVIATQIQKGLSEFKTLGYDSGKYSLNARCKELAYEMLSKKLGLTKTQGDKFFGNISIKDGVLLTEATLLFAQKYDTRSFNTNSVAYKNNKKLVDSIVANIKKNRSKGVDGYKTINDKTLKLWTTSMYNVISGKTTGMSK